MVAKKWAMILGIVFLLIGVLGLVGGMGIVGASGIFMTDTVHDFVHLITGLVFLIIAMKSPGSAGLALKIFGVIYLLVGVLGFFSGGAVLGFLEVNGADNVLHVILGIVILALGFMSGKKPVMMGGGMGSPMA